MAIRTFRITAVPAQQDTNVNLVLLRFEIAEVLAYTVEFRFTIALENQISLSFGEVAERHIEADAAPRLFLKIFEPFEAAGFGPRLNGAFIDRKAAVGNREIERIIDGVAKPLTARTCAGGAVEAEENRLGRIEFDVVVLAAETLAEQHAVLGRSV